MCLSFHVRISALDVIFNVKFPAHFKGQITYGKGIKNMDFYKTPICHFIKFEFFFYAILLISLFYISLYLFPNMERLIEILRKRCNENLVDSIPGQHLSLRRKVWGDVKGV